jgi:adenylate kinase
MKVFEAETAPVLPHYRSQGRFAEVNGLQDVDLVTREVLAGLARLRGGSSSHAGAPRGA